MNYTYRMHDPRVGRFFATDPLEKKYPWYSPYQFGGNSPIMSVELEGLEESKTVNSNQIPVHGTMDKKRRLVYLTNDDPEPEGVWVQHPTQKSVDKTYKDVKEGIAYAEQYGSKFAAANMKYWLSGKGGTISFPESVRQTTSYKDALQENIDRFLYEDNAKGVNVYDIATRLKNGQSAKFSDYWENCITFDALGTNERDLYYAWGTITLKTRGEFLIKKDANGIITINARFTNELMDNYNWNPNKTTPLVLGDKLKIVHDNDLLLLEVFKGAKSFKGYSKNISEGQMTIARNGSSSGFKLHDVK